MAQKTGIPKWVALVSGHLDQNLRNPSCLILSHTHMGGACLCCLSRFYAKTMTFGRTEPPSPVAPSHEPWHVSLLSQCGRIHPAPVSPAASAPYCVAYVTRDVPPTRCRLATRRSYKSHIRAENLALEKGSRRFFGIAPAHPP